MMEADDDDDDDDYQEADSSMAQAIDDDYLLHVEDVFPTGNCQDSLLVYIQKFFYTIFIILSTGY